LIALRFTIDASPSQFPHSIFDDVHESERTARGIPFHILRSAGSSYPHRAACNFHRRCREQLREYVRRASSQRCLSRATPARGKSPRATCNNITNSVQRITPRLSRFSTTNARAALTCFSLGTLSRVTPPRGRPPPLLCHSSECGNEFPQCSASPHLLRHSSPPAREHTGVFTRIFGKSVKSRAEIYGFRGKPPSPIYPRQSFRLPISTCAPCVNDWLRNPPVIQFPVPLAHARMHQARIIIIVVLFRCARRAALMKRIRDRDRLDIPLNYCEAQLFEGVHVM